MGHMVVAPLFSFYAGKAKQSKNGWGFFTIFRRGQNLFPEANHQELLTLFKDVHASKNMEEKVARAFLS